MSNYIARRTNATQLKLQYYTETLGFDQSTLARGGAVRIRCSQCESLVICGVPTHEHGCPNATKECRGCNERIPANTWQKYCNDCN